MLIIADPETYFGIFSGFDPDDPAEIMTVEPPPVTNTRQTQDQFGLYVGYYGRGYIIVATAPTVKELRDQVESPFAYHSETATFQIRDLQTNALVWSKE